MEHDSQDSLTGELGAFAVDENRLGVLAYRRFANRLYRHQQKSVAFDRLGQNV